MTPPSRPTHPKRQTYGIWEFGRLYLRWLTQRGGRALPGLDLPPDEAGRLAGAYTYCIAVTFLMCLLLPVEYAMGNMALLMLLGGMLGLCLAGCFFISLTNRITPPVLVMAGYSFAMCAYFLYSGLADQNTVIYYFWVVPVLVVCLSTRLGTLLSLFFILMMILLFLPPVHSHLGIELPVAFRFRFVMGMFCMFIVSAMAEYYLHYVFKQIFTINRQLEQYSLTDTLTGQGNRRNFTNQFQRLQALQVRSGEPFSIVMVDLDHFKRINDAHGHLLGDEVLCFVAEVLARSLRQQDSLYRWGGEEFIVLLPGTALSQAEVVAERMRLALESEPFTRGQLSIPLTASLGVYMVETAQPMHEHLKKVDMLLYRAKAEGRNRVISQLGEGAASVSPL